MVCVHTHTHPLHLLGVTWVYTDTNPLQMGGLRHTVVNSGSINLYDSFLSVYLESYSYSYICVMEIGNRVPLSCQGKEENCPGCQCIMLQILRLCVR